MRTLDLLPSEGKGHTFESCRVRHFSITPEQNWAPQRWRRLCAALPSFAGARLPPGSSHSFRGMSAYSRDPSLQGG